MQDIIKEDKRRKLDRPFTGIIQNDRIWEQWYDADVFKKELPKMNQKDYLFSRIGDQPNRIIINNRGLKSYSVSDFEKMILKYEKAFAASGLQVGDRVCTIGLTTPEMYAIKYAAVALGLITCNLNVLDMAEKTSDGQNKLYKQIKNVNPRMLFTLDYLEDKIYPVINSEEFNDIIKISMPLDKSTPIFYPERTLLSLKKMRDMLSGKKIDRKMSLNDFLSMGRIIDEKDLEEKYAPKMPCNISFTSGTTGANKAVLLSHDAINALAFQQEIANFGFEVGSKHLALLPPFLAFWDADVVHVTLCLGAQNILELKIGYDEIPKYFKKYGDINLGIWPQYYWEPLLNMSEKDIKKISENLKISIIGGTRCEVNAAESFYNKTGVVQLTGYGASEVSTTFSVTHPNCNKIGSCGLPLPFNNVKIVDDSFNDLTYNKPGRLLITSPCIMNEYYNRPDLTERAFYTDKEGVKWYNTDDYAVMDTDGCLTVLDRYMKPVEINTNGSKEKVNLIDICEKIKVDRNVKMCKLTESEGRMILHLELDNYTGLNEEDAINSVMNTIKKNLPEKYWPDIINVSKKLPRTPVGKLYCDPLIEKGKEFEKENRSNEKMLVLKQSY